MTKTLNLNLEIKDKEVINYFNNFGSKINNEKALEALKVGVVAIQASGSFLESTKISDKRTHELQEHIKKEINFSEKKKLLNDPAKEKEFKASIQKSIEALAGELGDSYEKISNKGDFLITLGSASSAPDIRVVFIVKRKIGIRLSEALDELEEAKQDNNALIGCYIFPSGYGPLDIGESGFRGIKGNYFIYTREEQSSDIASWYKMLRQQAKFALTEKSA
jgi:hypothetical protein